MDQKSYLRQQITACRRKLNTAKLLDILTVFVALSGVGGFACELVSLFVPFYYAHLAAALCFLAGVLAGSVFAVIKRVDMRTAAKRLDSFGLKERMLTAYELMEREDDFARLQREDALQHYEAAKERIKISLIPEWRHLLAFVLSVALVIGLGYVQSAARDEAKVRHEVQKLAKEEIDKVEELLDALDGVDMDSLTEEQQEQLRQLAEALQLSREELAAANSMEGLHAAQERLDYKYEQAAQGLDKLAGQITDPAAVGIAGAEELAKALANNREQVASNGTPSTGNSGTGGDQDGDGDEGGDGSGDGNGDGDGSGNGNDGQSGDGSGNGNASGGGNGSGNNSGNGNSNGNGDGNGDNGSNGNGSGDGNSDGRGTGSSNRSHDYVSIPNALGDDPSLTGNQGSKEDSDYYRQQNGLAWEGDHVDYNKVIGSYTDRAYEGLTSGRYPSGMEEVIKGYFEGLNQ